MISKNNQVAFVTGAAVRIGADIVQALHEDGFRVALHCHHSLKEARALADKLNKVRGDSVLVLQKNLQNETVTSLIDAVVAWGGRLDVLVNNASIFMCDEAKDCDWDLLFDVNVKAPYLLSKKAFPFLAESQGCIINITDIHAKKPLKGYSLYCQTKAALSLQTKSLATAFAPLVRVNAIAPGAIAWPLKDNALSQAIQEKIIAQTPLKRHGSPEFISQTVLFLVHNTFMTGQEISVDGGRSLGF